MAKARQQYFADEVTLQKENRDFAIQPELVEKLEGIEAGAQVNVIETVKVNGEALIPDEDKAVDVSVPLVEDTLYSTDTDKALSANQGKVLYEYIQNLASRGRYLSNWNTATGLPTTNPVDNPYQYRAGDYYVVSNVAALGGTNYRPDGSSYSRNVASTTVESETVKVGDFYTYDGQNRLLLVNTEREIAVDSNLSTTSTNPVENRVITSALNLKANDADISVVGKTNDFNDLDNIPSIPDSLDDLTGTSDDITEGSTHLFLTSAERTKLTNTTGVNTGDETNASIMSKLGAASSTTNGYLTVADWNTFNNKQDAISDLATIRSNASAGKSASDTIATYGDIVTHDANEFATAAQGGKADTALQPGDNVSELTNDAGYVTDAYHDSTKQDKLIAGANIQIASDGKTISATDTTYVAGDFDIKDLADSTGLRTKWSGKQDELIAGSNIQIAADGKTISATDTTYSAGAGISISNNNVISAIDNKASWGSIEGTLSNQTDLQSALDDKQDTLTAGANIQIAQDGTISATDTTYTAGTGIDITNGVISNTQTSAEWGNISGTLSDQTDLQSALDAKQNTLTAGANIQISGDTISATDTKYTAADFDIKDLADSTGKRASWDAKQNAISDLATIRSNASTAIQPGDNVSELTNDAGYITSADIPTLDTAMSSTSTKGVQNKVIKSYVDTQVQEATAGAVSDTAYGSSWNGVTGIAPSKNAVYDKISAMDTTISGKQDTISDLATIRTGAGKGATAVQPGDNVSTLTNDAGFITKAVNDLTNYYTKSETYTKAEVADYVANFAGFKVVATLPTTDIKTTIIYLLGPVGTGADKYEEYIYSNNTWVKIGETSVDLTNYFNTSTDNSDSITQGSTNLFLTSAERTKLSNTSGTNTGDETKATIQSKLGAASSSASGYLTSTDWNTFNGKANASDVNTRTFYIASTSDTAGMQRVTNYLDIGNNPIVDYGDSKYTLYAIRQEGTNLVFYFYALSNSTGSGTKDNLQQSILIITKSSGGAYSMTTSSFVLKDTFLSKTNTTSYTPTGNYNPATKKYVDDTSAGKVNDTAYASSWDGVTDIAPSKNAVYDKLASMDTAIAGKQATISDLATIRSGAAAGATAVQPGDNVSTLNNDAGYLTSHQDISGKLDKITGTSSLDRAYIVNTSGTQTSYNVSQGASNGAIVRRSGTQIIVPETPTDNSHAASKKYVDDGLSGKQATLVSGTNIKSINNNSLLGSGNINVGDVTGPSSSTDGYIAVFDGTTGKAIKDSNINSANLVLTYGSQSINGTKIFVDEPVLPSKTTAATNSGTKPATEAQVYKKQDTLVSGTNIKTVNGNSLLGSGDITVNPGITKTFTLSGLGSTSTVLAEAQAIYDWYINGGVPVVTYNTRIYYPSRPSSTYLYLSNTYVYSSNYKYNYSLKFDLSSGTVTNVTLNSMHTVITTSLPSSPDANTIYLIK